MKTQVLIQALTLLIDQLTEALHHDALGKMDAGDGAQETLEEAEKMRAFLIMLVI